MKLSLLARAALTLHARSSGDDEDPSMQPSSQSTADGTGLTILMVEDDANVMDVGATILAD